MVPQFAFYPFLFFSCPSTIHYSDATEKIEKEELKVTFHQLPLCAKAYFFLKTP